MEFSKFFFKYIQVVQHSNFLKEKSKTFLVGLGAVEASLEITIENAFFKFL